jgi:hypothetical protein
MMESQINTNIKTNQPNKSSKRTRIKMKRVTGEEDAQFVGRSVI